MSNSRSFPRRAIPLCTLVLALGAASRPTLAQIVNRQMTLSGGAGIGGGVMGAAIPINTPGNAGLTLGPNPNRIPAGTGFRPPANRARASLSGRSSTLRQVIAGSYGNILGGNAGPVIVNNNTQNLARIRQEQALRRRLAAQTPRPNPARVAQRGAAAHQLTIGFPMPTNPRIEGSGFGSGPRGEALARSLRQRLGARDLDITADGDVATITGVVASESDRRLASRVVLLEPGIHDVENRLAIAEPMH